MDGENVLEITKIIKEMIKSDRIPGAFIFESERGGVRDSLAVNLAKTIVCGDINYKKISGEACDMCESCKKADKKIHPDIIIPEPGGDGGASFSSINSFHIDKIRDIIDGLYLAPNESDKKVYIIKDMQNMTQQGQNALLKSLEEPPPFVVFIITVSDGGLILDTVKSRAVRFAPDSAGGREKKAPPQAFAEVIRDILAQNPDKFAPYHKLLAAGLEKSDKTEVINFYSYIENALRDIMIAKIFAGADKNTDFLYYAKDSDNSEELNKLSNLYSARKIIDLLKKIRKYKSDLDYNINIRLNLTSFLSGVNI